MDASHESSNLAIILSPAQFSRTKRIHLRKNSAIFDTVLDAVHQSIVAVSLHLRHRRLREKKRAKQQPKPDYHIKTLELNPTKKTRANSFLSPLHFQFISNPVF